MKQATQPQALSAKQLTAVLELIAGRASTLNELLMTMQAKMGGDSEARPLLDAAQALAELLGAMADDATGGAIYGDMRDWLYGPRFKGAV